MTVYAIREVGDDKYEVAKFGDRNVPENVYLVQGDRCNCAGSVRSNSPCTHRKSVAGFKEADLSPVGVFYEPDTDAIYRPIPLDYPFNISAALEDENSLEVRSDVPRKTVMGKNDRKRSKIKG